MKKIITSFGISLMVSAAVAQSASDYNRSVFADSKPVSGRSTAGANARTSEGWKGRLPGWTAYTDKQSGAPRDLYGPAAELPGSSLNDKLDYCRQTLFPALGLEPAQWSETNRDASSKAQFVRFEQTVDGRKVAFSTVILRFTNDNKLLRIVQRQYGSVTASRIALTPAQASEQAVADIAGAQFAAKTARPDWEWFPVPSADGYTLRAAYAFRAEGRSATGSQLELEGYVDAETGDLLYRDNQVKESFSVKVKGSVYKTNTQTPATDEPMANMLVKINGNTYYTDTAGVVTDSTLLAPASDTIALVGRWSSVRAVASNSVTPSFSFRDSNASAEHLFPVASPSSERHVNAYYHVNRVHNFMKGIFTSFTGMDFALPTNVDATGGSCNAFYSSQLGSINFYAAGGGCPCFATFGDIIYHEYGHGISDKFYGAHGAGTIRNGGLNEACSDIWGISITGDPVLGRGALGGSTSNIRRYDQNPKVFPNNIVGEVHADGEIIAGCWWDTKVNIGSLDTMTRLFTETYYDTPDGPNGSEGSVYHEVLISALMADDDNNNLTDRTPHFSQIVAAFARHGIYLLGDATVTHNEIDHQPAGSAIPFTATVNLTNPFFLQDMKLFFRKRGNGTWDSSALTRNNMTFSGTIPAQTEGSIVDYYFAMTDYTGAINSYFPVGYSPRLTATQSTIPYQFGVGLQRKLGYNFESGAPGWSIGSNPGDAATAGIWVRAIPNGNSVSGLVCQTGSDHTTGSGYCLVTGNSTNPNTQNVNNGATTVITPPIDLSGYTTPIIEYYRWFSNDRGGNARTDYWTVQIRDTSSPNWSLSVDQTYQSDYHWRRKLVPVRTYAPTANAVQMRFIASDNANASIIQAAMDDFYVYDLQSASTGVSQTERLRASIYPNPAREAVNVVLPESGHKGTITLSDIGGRQLMAQEISGGTEFRLSTAALAPGSYFISIRTEQGTQIRQIAVVR